MNCDIINSTEAITATADISNNANDIINTVNTVNSSSIASDSNQKGHDHEKSKCTPSSTNGCATDSDNCLNGVVMSSKANDKTTNCNKTATVNKSWYARCSRWRSQSCDRKNKNVFLRYSWNNNHQHHQPDNNNVT